MYRKFLLAILAIYLIRISDDNYTGIITLFCSKYFWGMQCNISSPAFVAVNQSDSENEDSPFRVQ